MIARVLSVNGGLDGIRWGDIRFGWLVRRWVLDRLSGEVRLWDIDSRKLRNCEVVEDLEPERLRAARQAIAEALAGERRFGSNRIART